MAALAAYVAEPLGQAQAASNVDCDVMGWFPIDFGLKDHAVFSAGSYYYLVSNYLHPGDTETRFVYARSEDLCVWEELAPVLPERVDGTWDEFRVWAPFVYEEAGTYYMYYTGVTDEFTQSILLATTTDPADPQAWQPQGMVFQPAHTGALWNSLGWADCRDPMVLKNGSDYYLFYSGLDETGGIIGMATASAPEGPWADRGAILTLSGTIPESATVWEQSGRVYLFFTLPYVGGRFVSGPSLAGPWDEPLSLNQGWAHEVWPGPGGLYASFLTSYAVTIAPLTWDTFFEPPRPFIGAEVFHLMLPMLVR